MPYEDERATYQSIMRLTANERVQNLLRRMKRKNISQDKPTLPTVNISDISLSEWQLNLVLAIDGGLQRHDIDNGYPGAEIGYVTAAVVLMDVEKLRNLDSQRPINPIEFRKTENVESIDSAFPGCNIVIDTEDSPKNSLRKSLFETFKETSMFSDGESLLDTYEALLAYKQEDPKPDCPYKDDDNCSAEDKELRRGNGIYTCHCSEENMLYSTDSLRIHERMVPDSANGEMFGEIMQSLERILVIHVLRWFEKKDLLWLLSNMGIVIDGQLAVFGSPAWLHSAIRSELCRINEVAKKDFTEGQDLLMIGVEKSGTFVNHFERIDQSKIGMQGEFPSQHVFLLTDEYIKENINFSESKKPYGLDTHFGRKFFYKTASGARLVATLPFLHDSHSDMTRANPEQFPRLADALGLLDQLVSSRIPNALSPIISAHAEAAIPMNLGARVLEETAKKLIQERNHGTH